MSRSSIVLVILLAVAALFIPFSSHSPSAAGAADRYATGLDSPVPQDSACTVGRLPNGLTYYIRVNREPEKRAMFWLAVNAGSIQEDKDQLGLAHFTEHMGFNGTKHFPPKELVKRFEKLGVMFGLDLNAYTSVDETVYQLHVPTDSAVIVETAFQALEDWARWQSFNDQEIEKERGVIVEEWRLGVGAGRRIQDKEIPEIFCSSRYGKRLPIGKKEIIESFNHGALERFYRDWYRPDLMAVIAVGDFDPDQIHRLIVDHFASMPAQKHPRERVIYPVPDHRETLVSIVTDPEATENSVGIYFKRPVRPTKTLADYRVDVMQMLLNVMFQDRMSEISRKPDSPIMYAGSGSGRFVRSKAAYGVSAIAKQNQIVPSLELALTEVERVRRYSFTETELERAKTSVLRIRQKFYDESGKLDSRFYLGACLQNFLRGAPIVPPEQQLALYQRLLPTITLEDIRGLLDSYITKDNRVVLVSLPKKEGYVAPSKNELLAVVRAVGNKSIEPHVEIVPTGSLIADKLTPAAITSERRLDAVDATEWTLSNGVRVVLKPTDFNRDRVEFIAMSPGGTSLVSDADYLSARYATGAAGSGGYGSFSAEDLEKKLTGTIARVEPWIGDVREGFSGGGSTKDIETMFQLIYLKMTSPRRDEEEFRSSMNRWRESLKTQGAAPQQAWWDTMQVTLSQHHFRKLPITAERLDAIDLDKALAIYRERFSDASDFVFVFVGNMDMNVMRRLSQEYLGNLPATYRHETWKDEGVRFPTGVVTKTVRKGIDPKASVRVQIVFGGPFEWSQRNEAALKFMADVLSRKLREVVREDLSGTYGIYMGTNVDRYPRCEYNATIGFGCAPERVDELRRAVFAQIDSVKAFGIDTSYVNMVRATNRKWHEREIQMNMVWAQKLAECYFSGDDLSTVFREQKLSSAMDAKTVQDAARKYIDMNNYVEVDLLPEGKD